MAHSAGLGISLGPDFNLFNRTVFERLEKNQYVPIATELMGGWIVLSGSMVTVISSVFWAKEAWYNGIHDQTDDISPRICVLTGVNVIKEGIQKITFLPCGIVQGAYSMGKRVVSHLLAPPAVSNLPVIVAPPPIPQVQQVLQQVPQVFIPNPRVEPEASG